MRTSNWTVWVALVCSCGGQAEEQASSETDPGATSSGDETSSLETAPEAGADTASSQPGTQSGAQEQSTDDLEAEEPPPDPDATFISWDALVNDATPEFSVWDVRSAAYHPGYDGGDLVVSVADDDGKHSVFSIDLDEMSTRPLQFHRECGACIVGSSVRGILLANDEGLWESTDGGYRFAQLAAWKDVVEPAEAIAATGSGVWVLVDGQWRFPEAGTTAGSVAEDWPGYAVSIAYSTQSQANSALVLSARQLSIHSDTPATSNNPCTDFLQEYTFGSAWHFERAAIVPCGDATVAVSTDIEQVEFDLVELDSNSRWMGMGPDLSLVAGSPTPMTLEQARVLIATELSWYELTTSTSELKRLGGQAPSVVRVTHESEPIYLVDSALERGLRVSNLGIAITPF